MENDSLKNVLREWQPPKPNAALDARMKAAYRAAYRPSPWYQFWKMRVTLPLPAVAAALLLIFVLFLQFRSAPAPVAPRTDRGYVTRLEATGFQPLPNGAARVVSVEGVRQ